LAKKRKAVVTLPDKRRSLNLAPFGNVPIFCQNFAFFEMLLSLPLEKGANFVWVIWSFRNKISIHRVFALQ